MIPAVRQQSILSSLRSRGALSVEELAATLGVSTSTIRRDLAWMEGEGRLRRRFGGAVAAAEGDQPLRVVAETNAEAKRAIGRAAARQVQDGTTVVLDIGTTALAVARELAALPDLGTRGLTVVTASLPVFRLLGERDGVHLILLGGSVNPTYQCTSGHLAELSMRELRADLAFLGCSGVAADGTIRDTTIEQVPVKRAIVGAATETVLLADAAKFPGQGTYGVLPVDRVHRVITDHADLGTAVPGLPDTATEVVVA